MSEEEQARILEEKRLAEDVCFTASAMVRWLDDRQPVNPNSAFHTDLKNRVQTWRYNHLKGGK